MEPSEVALGENTDDELSKVSFCQSAIIIIFIPHGASDLATVTLLSLVICENRDHCSWDAIQ